MVVQYRRREEGNQACGQRKEMATLVVERGPDICEPSL
jgi:hypothetical protein